MKVSQNKQENDAIAKESADVEQEVVGKAEELLAAVKKNENENETINFIDSINWNSS